MNIKILTRFLLISGFILFTLFFPPNTAHAGIDAKSHGYVKNQNGDGINGVPIEYHQYRPRNEGENNCPTGYKPGDTNECCYHDPGVTDANLCWYFNTPPTPESVTRDDPYNFTGPGWYQVEPACGNLRFYIFMKMPGSNEFIFVPGGTPSQQANNFSAPSNVLGVSSSTNTKLSSQPKGEVLALIEGTPPPNTPPNCRIVLGTIPGYTADNVLVNKDGYELICDDNNPSPSPSPSCPTFEQAVSLADSCDPTTGWSTIVKIDSTKFPKGSIDNTHSASGIPFTGYQIYVSQPDGSDGQKYLSKTNAQTGTFTVNQNLTDFVVHQYNSTIKPVPTPLKSSTSYTIMVYNGSESCKPSKTLSPTTCAPPSPSPSPAPVCKGTCDLSSATACQGAGYLPGCVCVKQTDNSGICQPCPPGTSYDLVTKTCEPPPQCNYDCSRNPKSCEAAKDGCTACVINGGSKTCQACPPDTVYNPTRLICEGPTCNQPCNPANNTCEFHREGNTCNFCNPSTSKCEVCPAGSEFNPETKTCDFKNACKCDSLSYTPSIFPGQLVRFTANSKIEGPAVKNASQKYIFFQILVPKDRNNQNGETTEVAKSGLIIPTKIEDSPTRKRYTANWDFRIPFNIQRGTNYRVIAHTTDTKEGQKLCDANPITTQSASGQNTAVLAATATSCGNLPGWLCNIADAWKCSNLNLFKDQSAKDYCSALEAAKQAPSTEPAASFVPAQANLQLDQLSPAKTEKDGCNTILFKFENPK